MKPEPKPESRIMDAATLQQLAKKIESSPLDNPVRDYLLKKLKVASSTGKAAVVREFDEEMEKYRAKHLPSHRRHGTTNKKAIVLHTA